MQEKDLTTELSHRMGWTQQETSEWVTALGTIVSSRLVDGDGIGLQGLGRFETEKLNECILKDTGSGKQYLMPPALIPVFHADDNWEELLRLPSNITSPQQ